MFSVKSGRRNSLHYFPLIFLCLFNTCLGSGDECSFQTCYTPPGRTASCFQFFPKPAKTWAQAKTECEKRGGALASHEDYEEWLWTKTELDGVALGYVSEATLRACGGLREVSMVRWWIGGYLDKGATNTWKWTGIDRDMPSAHVFKAKATKKWNDWKGEWAIDHPDTSDGQACVALSFSPSPYNWESLQCGYRLPFVCKWKQKNRNNVCDLPVVYGSCDQVIERYYYDFGNKKCKTFQYGGCNGGPNMFASASDCDSACPGTEDLDCYLRAEDGAFNIDGAAEPTLPILAAPNVEKLLKCPKGFEMMIRNDESYTSVASLFVRCGSGGVWEPPLPLCVPDCRSLGDYVDSMAVIDSFWKRFWHHRTDCFLRGEVFRSCYSFMDSAKEPYSVAVEKCKRKGAKIASGLYPLAIEMINDVSTSVFWRGRMRYIIENRDVSPMDSRKKDYEEWWIGGTVRDQIDGIKGFAVGDKEFFQSTNLLSEDPKTRKFFVCEKAVPFPSTDEIRKILDQVDEVLDPFEDPLVDERRMKEIKEVVDAFDKSVKPTVDDEDEEKERKRKIEFLREKVKEKEADCCAILRPAMASEVEWSQRRLSTLEALSVVTEARRKAKEAGCPDDFSCSEEAKRIEEDIKNHEAGGGGGGGGGTVGDSCDDPGFVAAHMGAPGTCDDGKKAAAKGKVATTLSNYLSSFKEAEDGKYSRDGTGFKSIYNKEKKKKFLDGKPIGPAVEWLTTAKPLVKELIKEGTLDENRVKEFEEFVLKESMEEQKRIMKKIQEENRKSSPDPFQLQFLVDEYKTASPFGGSAGDYLDDLVEEAKESTGVTTSTKPKNVDIPDTKTFLRDCDVIHSLSKKCGAFLQGEKSKMMPQVDVREVELVRSNFARGNTIKAQLCKGGKRTSGDCEDSKVSGQNVKHDMDVRLGLKAIVKFGLDTDDDRILKKVVDSPYMKAAEEMGLDNRGRIDDVKEGIEVVEEESGPLAEPTLDSTEFSVASCDAAFEPKTENITKAMICLQAALAGKVGDDEQVKDRMKPEADKWPMRLSVMVEKAIEKLKEASELDDVDEKKEALKKMAEKGFPGLGPNQDSTAGRRLVTYVDKIKKGSCASKRIKDALDEMRQAELYRKNVELGRVEDWRKALESEGRPALNGETAFLDCEENDIQDPLGNRVECKDGRVEWDENARCVRKTCPKPSLAAGLQFYQFENINLHTRKDENNIAEGILKVKVMAEFHRPTPVGKYDAADRLWKYICGPDRGWSPSLGSTPSIDKERPTCPDIPNPQSSVDGDYLNPYENFIFGGFNRGLDDYKKAGTWTSVECQAVMSLAVSTSPNRVYCNIHGDWSTNENTAWNGIINCSFKGTCKIPQRKKSGLNVQKDTFDCFMNTISEDCEDKIDLSEEGWDKSEVPPETKVSNMDCGDVSRYATTLDVPRYNPNTVEHEVQHYCSQTDVSGNVGFWIAAEYDRPRLRRIVPMPTLETPEFFCHKICPDGFDPVVPFMLVNTMVSCCGNSGLQDLFGCYKKLRDMTYDDAKMACEAIDARLPEEKEVGLMCFQGSQIIACPLLVKQFDRTGKAYYKGGNWINSLAKDKRRFVGYISKPNCPLPKEDFTQFILEDERDLVRKTLCVTKFLTDAKQRFWNEIERLSNKCQTEGFYWTKDSLQHLVEHWRKCTDAAGESCCLTLDQWKPTRCNKDNCKDPLRALACLTS